MLNLTTCRVMLKVIDDVGTIRAQDASDADFTIDSEAPSIPILIAPANNAYLRDSMPCFRWHKSIDVETKLKDRLQDFANKNQKQNYRLINKALDTKQSTDNLFIPSIAQYQLQYATNSNFTGAIQIITTDTFYQVPTRLIDTTYYWRVKAIDSAGNQSNWSSVWSFEIDTRAPNAPVLISPVNGVWLTNTNVIFNWSQVTFGDNNINVIARSESYEFVSPIRYILQVDTNRNFTNPITDTTSYLYDTLTLTQARYFWRVRAYDLAGNQGIFSSADSFGIDYTPPSVPNLISPANNAILNDSFVRFYWNRSTDNVSGIKHYQIQIAKNSNFTNAFDTTVVDTTLLRKLTDTTYYWRVKAFDVANNQSSWSTVWSFTVQTTGIEELTNIKAPSIFYLYHNRPNPFSNITEITYSIPIATKVKLTIFNATGEEIAVLINCLQKPGLYSVIWNGRDNAQNICPNDIYFYRLETKEFQNTKKMLLLR